MEEPGPMSLKPLDETHDPNRRSWVESANGPGDFPIQNLPLGVFRRSGEAARGGVAIGDMIFDLKAGADLFTGDAALAAQAASGASLNPLMALGNGAASALRLQLSRLLAADRPEADRPRGRAQELLVPAAGVEMLLPAQIGAFTDMMISTFHVGGGRRGAPSNELPGRFKTIPLGYNGRASSVVASGTPVLRPRGVYQDEAGSPAFGPEPRQDFELELGAFVGAGNPLGTPIPIGKAAAHVFGYCLLNDWSARAIQFFEMPPLGPFLGKSLATSISPWIVTAEALAPFATAAFARPAGDPAPLPHLADPEDQRSGGLDLALEAYLSTSGMRRQGEEPARICRTNFKFMYWTVAQLVAHHTSNGCNLRPGDLVGSGTVSGPGDEACGCLWELTAGGKLQFALPNGERRLYLEDDDEVIFRGHAAREGFVSIGFGECRGRIVAAAPVARADAE
jgi:fumarylacetoacetase